MCRNFKLNFLLHSNYSDQSDNQKPKSIIDVCLNINKGFWPKGYRIVVVYVTNVRKILRTHTHRHTFNVAKLLVFILSV